MVFEYARHTFLWYDKAVGPQPKNQIGPAQIRPAPAGEKPWGMTAPGKFEIADDEALVFTLQPQGARYLGVLITDPWMVSVDYSRRGSSLNNLQAWHNPDGSITYVVAARDPEVHNWLDTGGIHDGALLVRWELVEDTLDPTTAVVDAKLVKLRNLSSALPFAMPSVSNAERKVLIARRYKHYLRRLHALGLSA